MLIMAGHLCGKRCPCMRFSKMRKEDHFPLVTAEIIKRCSGLQLEAAEELQNDTWLVAREESDQPFAIGCAICSAVLMPSDLDVAGRFELPYSSG
eukprot:s1331_g9.t1